MGYGIGGGGIAGHHNDLTAPIHQELGVFDAQALNVPR